MACFKLVTTNFPRFPFFFIKFRSKSFFSEVTAHKVPWQSIFITDWLCTNYTGIHVGDHRSGCGWRLLNTTIPTCLQVN